MQFLKAYKLYIYSQGKILNTTIIKAIGTKIVKVVESGVTKVTARTSPVIAGALERTPAIEHFERVATRFSKPDILDPILQGYIKRINAVPVEGGVTKEELPILRMVQESMFEMLKRTQGKSPLFDKIIFESIRHNGIIRKQGVACVNRETRTLHVNRDYLENIDGAINDTLGILTGLGAITKDKTGKYRIAEYLRNSRSEIFERRLNEYSRSWSLEYKFLLHRTSMNYYANLANQAYRHPIVIIEKIMKSGDNYKKLQKLGLSKTPAEVLKMNTEEQVAYLKQIGKICPPPVDSCLVTYPKYVFNHEGMHRYHYDNITDKLYAELSSPTKIADWKNDKVKQYIAAKVSYNAGTQPMEYVADVGAGIANGQLFDSDVMLLYEKLKGPKL